MPFQSIARTLILTAAVLGIGVVSAAAQKPNPALLDPAQATEKAPETYRVQVETTKGTFAIEVNRSWAPHGADRFYNLVTIGYYDGVAFYRVINGFMAQFGMNGDPAVSAAWMSARIPPDEVKQSNTTGKVTFAMGGSPDTRTTQIFINYGDNSYLDPMGFAPFGTVVEGFDVVEQIYSGYGEGEPRGKGPAQSKLFRRGNPYLKAEFPKMDYIVKATVVE